MGQSSKYRKKRILLETESSSYLNGSVPFPNPVCFLTVFLPHKKEAHDHT